MAYLVLVRHGESVWNAVPKFTGWVDILLTEKGRNEAATAGKCLARQHMTFDAIFTSTFLRAQETLLHLLYQLPQDKVIVAQSEDPSIRAWSGHPVENELPLYVAKALNERYYGDLQGLNKNEMKKKYGEEQVHIWRRSYDIPPPNGESLKDTCARTLPYFKEHILSMLNQGKNVLIVAHGNSLRSIMMYLEHISETDIPNVEIPTGVPIVYMMEKETVVKKDMLTE